MSVLLDLNSLSPQQLEQIDKDLNITVDTHYLQPYRVQESLVFIPFAYGVQHQFKPMIHQQINTPLVFTGKLRDEQKIVRSEMTELLNQCNSIILSTHVGFGKSILATYFAYKIKLKTLIVVNRLVLIKQWVGVLEQFIQAPKVCVIKPSTVIDWDCDFFIVNAINIPKIGYMPEIGLVIVDEVHLIMSKILSTCFQYVTPSYLIGLSATPYRTDGLDVLFDIYFGKQRIDRQLKRKHFVYRVETNFTPIVNRQRTGKIDWNDILNQQALDDDRNNLVVKIILMNPTLNFMVLCKRIDQIKLLQSKLEKYNIEAEYIYGDKQPDIQRQNRILIGTTQKLGTGFDAPWLNALLVASDLEAYFIQYLGRVFRKLDIVPIIFDLVDNNSVLKKHYKTREQTYIKHGGFIR